MKWEFKPNVGLKSILCNIFYCPRKEKGCKFHWEIGGGVEWLIPSNILSREGGYQLLTNSWDMLGKQEAEFSAPGSVIEYSGLLDKEALKAEELGPSI